MPTDADVELIAGTLGRLLLRHSRAHLYGVLVEGLDGVDETLYPVLSGLDRLGSVTATELADEIGLDRTVTTRYVTRLEDAGLVERRAHPHDARATSLALTRRGRRTVHVLRTRLTALLTEVTAGWSNSERATFARLLRGLADGLVAARSD